MRRWLIAGIMAAGLAVVPAARAGFEQFYPPASQFFGVSLLGEDTNLIYPFWFSNDLSVRTKLDEFGQAGTTSDLLARLQPDGIHTTYEDFASVAGKLVLVPRPTVARPQPIVVVLAGNADVLAGVGAPTIEHNLAAAYAYLRARGCTVIPVVPIPNLLDVSSVLAPATKWLLLDTLPWTAPEQSVAAQVAGWIRRQPNAVDTTRLGSLSDGTQAAPSFAEQNELAQLVGAEVLRVHTRDKQGVTAEAATKHAPKRKHDRRRVRK